MAGGSIAVYYGDDLLRIGATRGVNSVGPNPHNSPGRVVGEREKGAGFASILATEIDRYREPAKVKQVRTFSNNRIGTPAALVKMQVLV